MKWQQECVERLVAPLPLREASRERLREELWGHLASVYEEELALSGNHESAKSAACNRLGDGLALAQEFNRNLSWAERLEVRLLEGLAKAGTGGDAGLRWSSALLARASLALLVISAAAIGLPGMTPASAMITWSTGTMLLALGAASAGMVGRELQTCRAGLTFGTIPVRLAACTAQGAAAGAAIWCAGYAVSWAICRHFDRIDLLPVVELFGREALLRAMILPVLLAPATAWAFAWQERRAHRLPEWPYLDASGGCQ